MWCLNIQNNFLVTLSFHSLFSFLFSLFALNRSAGGNWWSPTRGKVMQGCTPAWAPTWWEKGTATQRSWLSSVKLPCALWTALCTNSPLVLMWCFVNSKHHSINGKHQALITGTGPSHCGEQWQTGIVLFSPSVSKKKSLMWRKIKHLKCSFTYWISIFIGFYLSSECKQLFFLKSCLRYYISLKCGTHSIMMHLTGSYYVQEKWFFFS